MSSIKSVFNRLQRSLVLKTSVLSLLLILSFSIPNSFNAYADQPCNSNVADMSDSSYRGPVYLDSYWTDQSVVSTTTANPIKKEVGPGEGPSTFDVVLVNRSPSDIINVQGILNLPSGYVVAGTSGDPTKQNIFKAILRGATNPAVTSYDATVPTGSIFTLHFDINVLKQAKVGLSTSELLISYNTASDFRLCSSAQIEVPILLPGKVVLDAVSDTTTITPNKPNKLTISLENKGSADATGVVATIVSLGASNGAKGSSSSGGSIVLQSTTTDLVNLGSNIFTVGTIPANGKTTISTTVFPNTVASGTTQNVQLQLTYGNAYGYVLTTSFLTGVVISPDTNISTLNVSYSDKESSSLLAAGKLVDLDFTVTNSGTSTLSNVVISLTPPSSSLSIVGDSKWTIQNMNPGDTEKLSTKVFAATSLINTPTSFSVSANYISDGVAKADSLNLGAFVVGDINIQLRDISISNIGNTPTLTGTLLNQGSSTGLFTSVQLLHPELLESTIRNNTHARNGQSMYFAQGDAVSSSQGGSSGQFSQGGSSTGSSQTSNSDPSTPQYIGDLTADSPTPFSIPLSGTIKPGVHQVSFKVAYADDLKHFHESTLNGTLNVQQSAPSDNAGRGSGLGFARGGMMMFIYLPITGASAAIATVFVMRKRNSSKNKIQKNKKDMDIGSLLDDSSSDKK
jgi:hypothetical protein